MSRRRKPKSIGGIDRVAEVGYKGWIMFQAHGLQPLGLFDQRMFT